MAAQREALRDWHRLFGLLLTDFFTGSPFIVEVERELSGQVLWQKVQAGVYDCRWGIDTVRVVVAGDLPREAHNAPLHLFSASPELIAFGQSAYQQRSEETSLLLRQLFERLRQEDFAMSWTMEDFKREFLKEHLAKLTPKEREEVLKALPPEERLAGLPPEQIQQYLERLTAKGPAASRKPRRKK
jgi:hypothetical protein